MRKYVHWIIVLTIIALMSGCAHCSKTTTTFDGNTKGFNPYGDGKINIVRVAYWGAKQCILNWVGVDLKVEDTPITVEDQRNNKGVCACGEDAFLCTDDALEIQATEEWGQFCSCYQTCREEAQDVVDEGFMIPEEAELNCSSYCSIFSDETDGFADE